MAHLEDGGIPTHLDGKLSRYDQFQHPMNATNMSEAVRRSAGRERGRTLVNSFSSDSRASSASISSSAFSGLVVMAHRVMLIKLISDMGLRAEC